jgi:hypothetical protein
LQVQGIWDENWVNGPIKIDGFEVMTACKSLELNAQNASEFSAFAALNNFKGWGVSNCMKLTMPDDNTVGLCSMETILNKILAGDFDSKPAIFRQGWNDITKEEAVPVLLAPCNPV